MGSHDLKSCEVKCQRNNCVVVYREPATSGNNGGGQCVKGLIILIN